MQYDVLYCTILYCTKLNCTELHHTVLYCTYVLTLQSNISSSSPVILFSSLSLLLTFSSPHFLFSSLYVILTSILSVDYLHFIFAI